MKRKLAILAMIALTIAALASCSNNGVPDGTTTNAVPDDGVQETTQEDALDARKAVPDNVPSLDFQGAKFRIVTQTPHRYDVIPETEGEVISDAIYRRNTEIEERFNISIDVYDDTYEKINVYAEKSILAQDNAFDLFAGQAVATSALVLKGYMLPWQEVKYIDFSQKWWSRSTTDDLTVNGKTYVAIGDFSLSALYTTYCMFFDKTKAADYALPDMYALVEQGKWTLDTLSDLTKNIYTDLNGNGQKDVDDYFGFATDPNSNLDAYLWAFDNPVMRKNAAGIPELVIKTEKIHIICEKLYDLLFNNQGSYSSYKYVGRYGYSAALGIDFFEAGKCLFANGFIGNSISDFRGVQNDYGIIPYPKFDEKQERYLTMADGQHAVLTVPLTAQNLDMIGAVTETLCAESWKTVFPAYYDVALKVKEVRDPQSVAMIDLIVDGRVFDFGYIYDNWQGMSFCLEFIFNKGNSNFESYYEKNEVKVRKHYANVLKCFDVME